MSIETALLILGLIMSFIVAICLGGNDAAEPTDCAVGAGVISIREAVILFAIFTAIGALAQGFMVMKTIGRGIVPNITIAGAFASVTSVAIWVILVASKLGIDVSVTHSIIGAVIGYGLASVGISNMNLHVLYMTILSWVTSPLASMLLAFLFYKIIIQVIKTWKIDVYSKRFERTLSYFLIGSLVFSAYAFGANDIGNATGVYVTVAQNLGRRPEFETMFLLALFGSIGIAIGGYFIGPKVVATMAYKVTRLNLITGFAAELSNALVVYLFTTIPYMLIGFGLPISTSLATAGSLMGVGLAAGGRAGVNKSTVLRLISFWILTVPVTMFLSFILYSAIAYCFHVR